MKKYYEVACDFETTSPNWKKIIDFNSKNSPNKQIEKYYETHEKPKVYSWVLTFNREYEKDIVYKACDYIGRQDTKEVIHIYGISLDSFFSFIFNQNKSWKVYFHNLKGFDGKYILPKLKSFGLKQIPKEVKKDDKRYELLKSFYKKEIKFNKALPYEYSTGIEKNKKIYWIKVYIPSSGSNKSRNKINCISFEDNLLMFNTSIKDMGNNLAEYFISKGMDKKEAELKYHKQEIEYIQEKGFISLDELRLSQNGKGLSYLLQDGYILNRFREMMNKTLSKYDFPINKWKRTTGSTAVFSWKKIFGENLINKNKDFIKEKKEANGGNLYIYCKKRYTEMKLKEKLIESVLPTDWLKNENEFNKIYKFYGGGICKVNELYRGLKLNNIRILDIVSSYPDTMNSDLLCPYGKPVDEKDGEVHLYKIIIKNKIINKNGLPFMKRTTYLDDNLIIPNEFEEKGMRTEYKQVLDYGDIYYLTNYEFDRFIKYYNPNKNDYERKTLYSFKAKPFKYFFGDYINHWYSLKDTAKRKGDIFLKNFAKVMLNALYGKFGTKLLHQYFIWDDVTESYVAKDEISDFIMYLPMAIFITSCARIKLVDAVGENYNLFVYCDTDSIFIKDDFYNKIINDKLLVIGDELGNWELENKHIYNLIVRRAKQYLGICYVGDRNCKWCKKPIKIAFAGINFMRNDYTIDYQETGNNISSEQKLFRDTLDFNDFIYGKKIPNQLSPKLIDDAGIVIYENIKEIPPIWNYPLMKEQIYKTKNDFLMLNNIL